MIVLPRIQKLLQIVSTSDYLLTTLVRQSKKKGFIPKLEKKKKNWCFLIHEDHENWQQRTFLFGRP